MTAISKLHATCAHIEKKGKDGEYDAYEVYAPVRRIVTEWEDQR